MTMLPITMVAIVLFTVCLVFLAISLILRHFRIRREHHAKAIDDTWRPYCYAAMVNDLPADLPPLETSDSGVITTIWLDCVERIRGFESTHGLATLAARLRLHQPLLHHLRSRNTDLKLQALLALGAMGDTRALPLATEMLDNDYPLMSLAAARALLEIDPHNGVAMVLDRLDNPGWPPRRIGQLLKLAPAKPVHDVLAKALDTWPAARLARLLELVHTLAESEFHQVAKKVMQRFPDDPVLLSCILALDDDPEVHALALRLSQHASASLRRMALAALGRVGTLKDQSVLLAAMASDDWLQQQTAARALAQLPGLQQDAAVGLLATLNREEARQHWQEALFLKGWLQDARRSTTGAGS